MARKSPKKFLNSSETLKEFPIIKTEPIVLRVCAAEQRCSGRLKPTLDGRPQGLVRLKYLCSMASD
jgi:hypothetical protein